MKKFIFIPILCVCLAGSKTFVNAQEYKNYNLNSYYTPDIVRNALDVNINLSGQFRNSLQTSDTSTNKLFVWDFNPDYSRYVSTRNKISTLNIYGNSNGSLSSYNYNNGQKSVTDYSNNFIQTTFGTRYYIKNKFFWYYYVNARFNYEKNVTEKNNSQISENSERKNYFLTPNIGIGKGRIENVTDARQAVYLLDALSKKGSMNRALNDREVFDFAQRISKVKNKRFLDARLRKIEEISTIDSFLMSNKYLNNQNAAYFTTLYDMWEYGGLFERNSGYNFTIKVSPEINYYSIYNKTEVITIGNTRNEFNKGASLNIAYSYEKSNGLDWQHSLRTALNLYLRKTEKEYIDNSPNVDKENMNSSLNQIMLYYTLSYFPSTRSRLYINTSNYYNLNHHFDIESNGIPVEDNRTHNLNTSTSINADYYLSPQLSISGRAYFDFLYIKQTAYILNNTQAGLSLGMKYSFF